MSEELTHPAARPLTAAGRSAGFLGRQWPWLVALAVAVLVPWLFYNWTTGRHSGFMVAMLSQMGIMIIFALSYNMQMGQAGLLSFGHAVFLGLGGYVTAHALTAVKGGALWLPLEITPLVGGLGGLAFAVVFGYFATKQRATAFAMITLGIGELVTACALMFHTFFGGEGGVSTNRMIGHSLFGLAYAAPIQVYYLIVAWTAIAVVLMLLLTRTPLGRMANACRDNFERAQFVGYDPRMVRFVQFSLSGFFAGIAGALYTLTYEIVTYDTVGGAMSANALLMTYIGGVGAFAGPVIGAVLIVLLQSWVSLLSNSWLVYAGVLFILMVTFAPGGIAGLVMMHQPIARAGRLRRLAGPYLRLIVPGALVGLGFVLAVELCSFLTIGAAQGKALVLSGVTIDPRHVGPWLAAAILLAGGGRWLRYEGRRFGRAWTAVAEEIKALGGRS
ncbi:MAG TPA: branched-chain amino acid ABC transporter permease [Methylomirabilota bacterium]|jgi:branched-chain amino acid transport system permease protein